MEEGKDFVVNADASVTYLNGKSGKTNIENEDLYSERGRLVYEVSHPERFSPQEIAIKKERIAELDKILGKNVDALKAGKALLLKKMAMEKKEQVAPNIADILAQAKQNG